MSVKALLELLSRDVRSLRADIYFVGLMIVAAIACGADMIRD